MRHLCARTLGRMSAGTASDTPHRPGPLWPVEDPAFAPLFEAASGDDVVSGVSAALTAPETARSLPLVGDGRTRAQWELLAALGARSLSGARVVEPHLDALGILAQAHEAGHGTPAPPRGLLGVYASESGGVTPEAHEGSSGWTLSGDKPWCSLAGECEAAVVTARIAGTERRRAFLVGLRDRGVQQSSAAWPALGLAPITTLSLAFDEAPARPVGPRRLVPRAARVRVGRHGRGCGVVRRRRAHRAHSGGTSCAVAPRGPGGARVRARTRSDWPPSAAWTGCCMPRRPS